MNGRGEVEVCWGGGESGWEACAGRVGRVRGVIAAAWGVRGMCVGRVLGVRGACVEGNKCWYRSLRFIIRIPW